MVDATIWTIIAVVGAGSIASRLSFIVLIGRLESVPPVVEELLRLVPPAVLAALILPTVVFTDGGVAVVGNDRLLAAVIAAIVAWRTEDILATVVVGMGVVWALGWLA